MNIEKMQKIREQMQKHARSKCVRALTSCGLPHLKRKSYIIKRLSAFVLMLAFFMPLSQCDPSGKSNDNGQSEVIVQYAYETEPPLDLAFNILAFFWPLLLAALFTVKKVLNSSLLAKSAEIVLCLVTVSALIGLNVFGEPLYGTYIALAAISIYGLLTLYEVFKIIQSKRHNKSSIQTGTHPAPPG